ncbi:MAG: peptidase [Gemmatimonadetes bacterium]|nr:peptidase [Gemmatimonadota bacterium]
MLRVFVRSLFVLAALPSVALSQSAAVELPRMLDDIKFLSDDRLEGRFTGTPDADTAAAYIQQRFKQVGLQAPAGGWFQEFKVEGGAAQKVATAGGVGRNVVGLLPGTDPVLREQVIVVGAHYDHLGGGAFGALDPDSTGKPHNGADDNASGVATIINLAQRMALNPPARTIVFVAFSGEELGLLGSAYYVRQPAVPLAKTMAMINFDMVGRLRNDKLIIYGTETATQFTPLLDSLNKSFGFDLKMRGDGYGPSDQSAFYAVKKPVLHFFTDLHEDYHRTTDDWQKINVAGMLKVSDFAAALLRELGDRPTQLTFVDQPPHAQVAAGQAQTPGYGAYLGTVPDMAGDVTGVKLSGVRPGSPAEKAGLQRDDIITRIGDMQVNDLQAMTDALRSHKPGDVVPITVQRDGKPLTVTVTLGART